MGKIVKADSTARPSRNSEGWDYDSSVQWMKEKTRKFKRDRDEIVDELITAYETLKNQGYRSDLESKTTSCQMALSSPRTFNQYCDDIGMPKRTAYRWLKQYDKEEKRFLEDDEYQARKKIEAAEKERERQYMIEQYEETGIRPEGWDMKTQRQYEDYTVRKQIQESTDKYGKISELPSIKQAAADLSYEPAVTGDQLTFFKTMQRNEEFLIKQSKSCPSRRQVVFLYTLEEYINEAEPQMRKDFVQQIVSKLKVILDELDSKIQPE